MRLLIIGGRDALSRGLCTGLGEEIPEAEIQLWQERHRAPEAMLFSPATGASRDDEPGLAIVYVAASRLGHHGLEPDLVDAEVVFEALSAERIQQFVVISSSAVHEPSAHHLQLLGEDRLAPRRTGNALPDAWQQLESKAIESLSDQAVTVLRPTPTLVPGGRDFWSRLMCGPMAFLAPGYDPSMQFLALEDLIRAVSAVLLEPLAGGENRLFHITPQGSVPLRKALRRARTFRLPVPVAIQRLLRPLLLGLAAPTRQLDWTRHSSTVRGDRIREQLGFEAQYSSLEAIDMCSGVRQVGDAREEDPAFDPFGLDQAYHQRLSATLFRFLERIWWRVEYRGLEHVPAAGPAVLAGVHRGFQPWDGVMAMDQIARSRRRYLRFLVHPTLIKPPFLTPYMLKLGGVPACRDNAEWVLERGGLLGIFPEGIRGAFKLYGPDIYQLGRFGRDEYVRFAIRAQAPIVPFVTVGSAEIFPILARFEWSWWRRAVEWPYFPITPTLGLVPLPSKWHTRFLEAIPTNHLKPEAAEDRAIVRQLSEQVKERMRMALEEMLSKRRHIFWGSLFEPEIAEGSAAPAGDSA